MVLVGIQLYIWDSDGKSDASEFKFVCDGWKRRHRIYRQGWRRALSGLCGIAVPLCADQECQYTISRGLSGDSILSHRWDNRIYVRIGCCFYLIIVTLAWNGVTSGRADVCTSRTKHIVSDLKAIQSWADLHNSFERFRSCDKARIAEEFSYTISRLLAR